MNEESQEQDSERPKVSVMDIVGILGDDWTGGMNSVAWVRAQRDR